MALGLLALLVYGADAFRHARSARLHRSSPPTTTRAAGGLAEAIAVLGDPLPLLGFLAVACAIALLRGRPRDALAATVVVAGANLTTQALKAVLAHPRSQTLLGGSGADAVGFPSGHTTAASSIAIAFALVVPPRPGRRSSSPSAPAFGLAVGLSVVVIAWHYPSDVIGGILVAAGWGFAVLAAAAGRSTARAARAAEAQRVQARCHLGEVVERRRVGERVAAGGLARPACP